MVMQDLLDIALTYIDRPYRWGDKGPDRFDCSGLVTWSLFQATQGKLDWRDTHNAERLFASCSKLIDPQAGCLAFYGYPQFVNHVVFYVGDGDSFSGVSRVFGACGGNHLTVDDDIAKLQNAKVKYRPSVNYRPDFIGYGMLALPVI